MRTVGITGGMAAPPMAPSSMSHGRVRSSEASSANAVTEMTKVPRRTGRVPNRLSCRDTSGPATAIPTENAASTRPAAV